MSKDKNSQGRKCEQSKMYTAGTKWHRRKTCTKMYTEKNINIWMDGWTNEQMARPGSNIIYLYYWKLTGYEKRTDWTWSIINTMNCHHLKIASVDHSAMDLNVSISKTTPLVDSRLKYKVENHYSDVAAYGGIILTSQDKHFCKNS